MGCCKCNGLFSRWSDPQPTVFKDADGSEYCVFHAPVEEKRSEMGGTLLSPREFERQIHIRIKNSIRIKAIECDFRETIFPHDVSMAMFKKTFTLPKMRFEGCVFHGVFVANEIDFQHGAAFSYAKFEGNVLIWRSSFGDDVDFSGAVINKKLYVYRSEFIKCVRFNGIRCQANSIEVEALALDSLKNLVFDSSLVSCIKFRGICDWPQKLGLEHHQTPPCSVKDLEELYRSMKQRAAEEHDQPQVSRWHFREKLMALKRGGNGIFEAVMLWLYWATSGFGERAVRAGVWLLALVVLSFVLNATPQPMDWNTLWGAAAANATMATIPFAKDIPGEGWVKVGRGFWQFLIAVQFTLFALAVRNRFRR